MSETILPVTAIMQEEEHQHVKEWTPGKVIYAGLMVFNLLSFLWLLVTGSEIEMPPIILFTRIATAPFAICLGKLWKDKGFWILVVYTLLFILRVFIPNPADVFADEISQNILSAIWVFTGCYGLGRMLNTKQLKHLLLACSTVWTVGMAVLCCLGIYVMWTEQAIPMFDGKGIYIYLTAGVYKRLAINYVSTTTAALMNLAILTSVISIICVKNRIYRIIMLVVLLPIILATALTDSRTAFISISAGMGVIAFSMVFTYFQKKETGLTDRSRNWKPWALGILIMAIVFALLIVFFLQIGPAFDRVKAQGVIPTALAEEIENAILANRGFSGSDVLNGRTELWTSVINYIKGNRILLLTGASKQAPTRGFNKVFSHCHCLYLQLLLETGIPGLLLFLTFIVYTMINSIRIIRTSKLPLWIRLLPALPAALWTADIVECFTWLRSSQCPMVTVLLISAGILSAYAPERDATEKLTVLR